MLSKNKKEIKSPFSLGPQAYNSSSQSENMECNNLPNNNSIASQLENYMKYNSSSDFIKTTYTSIPNSYYLKREIKLPLGLNISPLSNYVDPSSIPLIDYGKINELPACKNPKCLAFLNPYVEFINGGEEWKCNLCNNINKTVEYIKKEKSDIDELNFGTYEFISYKNCWNKKKPNFIPCFYLLIDISQISVTTGFAQCVLESIKDSINNNYIYNYENFDFNICIITYDENINFYPIDINKEDNDANIRMLTITESSDNLFLPTKNDFLLVSLKKYKNKIIQVIENIQNYISSENYNAPKESQRFFDAIKVCDLIGEKIGGKIVIFNCSNISKLDLMNSSDNDMNMLNDVKKLKYKLTDGGKISKFGINLSLHGFSINIFQACKTHTNIKTENQLIVNSNGNLYFYRNFSPELHYKNIYNQIKKIFQNESVYDAGMKFIFSHKFGIKEYITPVLLFNKEILFFPNLDSEQNYSLLLEMNYQKDYQSSENYIINDEYTYIQGVLYYTRGDGKYIIRVYNLCLPVKSNIKDIYDSINPEILGSLTTQQLIMELYRNKKLVESVNNFENRFYEIFNAYFNNLNMLKKEMSEEMKLYSLYILGILKNCLFNKNDKGINNDDDLTNFYFSKLQKIKLEEVLCFIYPKIYPLDYLINSEQSEQNLPQIINNNKESLYNSGTLFLIDNGFYLILYLRNFINQKIIFDLFNVDDINKVDFDNINEENIFEQSENSNELKNKISYIIDGIRNMKSIFQNLKIICEGINDQHGKIINENLIEDNFNKEYPISFDKFYNKIIFN